MINPCQEIHLPVFIYEEAKKKYKREHNLKYEMKYFSNLLEGGSDVLKYERIQFVRIGNKYIHLKIYDEYIQNACHFSTKKLIKMPRCYLYNHIGNYCFNIILLEQGKAYKIKSIEKRDNDYYTVINLKDEPVLKQQVLIDICNICMEEKQSANQEGYYKCSHKDCICNNCYNQLKKKICPLCRSI